LWQLPLRIGQHTAVCTIRKANFNFKHTQNQQGNYATVNHSLDKLARNGSTRASFFRVSRQY
jgi:hypothetical protein